jgi:DNA-binding XRE family transcriptional regulator
MAASATVKRSSSRLMLRIVCGLIVCNDTSWSSVAATLIAKRFGEKIRQLREARKLSQEDLADNAGLHRTHISLIERGQRSVRLETIERLAIALAVQPAQMMPKISVTKRHRVAHLGQ